MSHYFYAASLPAETKKAMQYRMEELKKEFPFRRWVHHEDLHITLAFLGSAKENELAESRELVAGALNGIPAFDLSITGLGTFGRKDQPRVFWASLQESPELQELRNRVFNACELAGFTLETRPFAPHLTLARNWEGNAPFSGDFKNHFEKLEFYVNEVVLYRTDMQSTPKYKQVDVYRLGSR